MKRLLTLASLGILVALVAPPRAADAQSLLFDYVGFDYEDPNPNPSDFGEAGSSYVGLGTVPGLFAPLVADTVLNEYTYVFSGLSPVSVTPVAPYLIIDYSPGTLSIYEDPKSSGTLAEFGANPPNALAPGTFTDGTEILKATLTGFQFVVNNSNGTGSFESALLITGGSQLGNFPINQRSGWTFAGSTGNALNIPPGYVHQIDGQTFLAEPTLARHTSWGRIKVAYR